jgi:SAM-dependent methyltransferase
LFFFATSKNRIKKAKKIEAVLSDAQSTKKIKNLSILDIGAGSGHIANYFSKNNNVIACDLVNQINPIFKKLKFKLITKNLPFRNASFDIVILNHVVIYVPNKELLFTEIRRVLKNGGLCYLATPNKYFPIEPHFKIPLLNFFPQNFYNQILSCLSYKKQKVSFLNQREIFKLAKITDFKSYDYTSEVMGNPKFYASFFNFKLRFPQLISKISPTFIFILRK